MKIRILTLLFMLAIAVCASAQQRIDISGEYTVDIDGHKHAISLPSTLDMAGIGTPTSLTPSLDKQVLQHLTRKVSYIGTANYEREISITSEMANRPLTFHFERVIWRSRLFIDGTEVESSQESLATPHIYYLPQGLSEGTHTLRISVDNTKQYDISFNDFAHAYTNETQTMWNGVLGEMHITAEPLLSIASLQAYPDITSSTVKAKIKIVRHGKAPRKATLRLYVDDPDKHTLPIVERTIKAEGDTTVIECEYPISNPSLWDEFSPDLYTLHANLQTGKSTSSKQTRFGMRQLTSKSGHLELNGNRIFLRGTLECCIFPLTGCPPTTDDGWRQVYSKAREWGLNHLRFHSYCPPDAAFRVADEMGFYLQAELPVWSTKIGRTPEAEAFLGRELDRILETYGNHPSFCLMTSGNEMQSDFNILNGLMRHARKTDPRRLYAATSFTFENGHGSKPEPEDEFFITQWTTKGWVRGQGVFDEQVPNFTADYTSTASGYSAPLISHEIGQYSVYPNLKEIEKYTGTLMPLNFTGISNDLKTKGLLHKAADYTEASGRLATILYKEEIERALRTPAFNGYQLLGLQDFPGQSTALVGLVDAFWDSKGVCEPHHFRQFCAPVVPLARFSKATYRNSETFTAQLEVANYSSRQLTNKDIVWSITNTKGDLITSGTISNTSITKGELTVVGNITIPLTTIKSSDRLSFSVAIDGTPYHNSWSIWVYDTPSADLTTLPVTSDIDAALSTARKGGRIILSLPPHNVKGIEGKFLPVFWSPVHFPKQAGSMGLLINHTHPALRDFPTEKHTDWQWWSIVKRSKAMQIDSIPGASPIVETIDNFVNNRRLATIFEAKLGKGGIIVTSIDLLTPDTANGQYKTGITPEIEHLRHCLAEYINSADFAPQTSITEQQLRSLILTDTNKSDKTDAMSVYQ